MGNESQWSPMSKKEDDDKVRMSQCEKKSIVVQGIKDRSEIR